MWLRARYCVVGRRREEAQGVGDWKCGREASEQQGATVFLTRKDIVRPYVVGSFERGRVLVAIYVLCEPP